MIREWNCIIAVTFAAEPFPENNPSQVPGLSWEGPRYFRTVMIGNLGGHLLQGILVDPCGRVILLGES
jgi:hypothetical protein